MAVPVPLTAPAKIAVPLLAIRCPVFVTLLATNNSPLLVASSVPLLVTALAPVSTISGWSRGVDHALIGQQQSVAADFTRAGNCVLIGQRCACAVANYVVLIAASAVGECDITATCKRNAPGVNN